MQTEPVSKQIQELEALRRKNAIGRGEPPLL